MVVLFVLIAIGVIAAIGMVAAGRLGSLPTAPADRRPGTRDGEPEFDVVLRGYRMDEVDAVVADLRAQVEALRDGTTTRGPKR